MVLPFCLFTLLPLSAQTFTQRLQKSGRGEGTITIHQSQAIDNLVNGPKQEQPKKPVVNTPEENKTTTAPEKSNTAKKEEAKEATKDVAKEATNDTVSIINIGRPHKIIGYRVQAFAGGSSRRDKQKAEQTASAIKQMFPSESVYTQYDNPRWTCRVGNFRTREEAKAMLSEIRKLGFNSANIIKTRVTVYD
jgi:pyruvate/2-oxoglutarate dehydrogenase complex dihydrolipoamide acyltransferase (E2) component